MKREVILIFVLFLVGVSSAATWVDDPANCPTSAQSQTCSGSDVVCGLNSGITYCYDPTLIVAPSSNSSTSNYNAPGFDGGFLLDCEAYDGGEPHCDNSGAFWCDRSSSCYGVNRQTVCVGGGFGASSCDTCISGYTYCDGSYVDSDGCEVDIGSTSFPGEDNAVYNSSCGAVCSGSYLDCDGDLGTGGDGCEIEDGGVCSVGALSGTYSGCSGSVGNCVVSKSYFETGTMTSYSTADDLLWAVQYGGGGLINMTNGNTGETFLVNGSGCIIFSDGSSQCSAGADVNLSGVVPYENASGNVDLGGYNFTTNGSGFFGWLGSLGDRIAGLFVQDVDASGGIVQEIGRSPVVVGNLTNSTYFDIPREVHVSGEYAYVMDQTNDLVVLSIADPENPVVVGSLDSSDIGDAGGIDVLGDYVYIVSVDSLTVIDVSNPSDPVQVSHLTDSVNLDYTRDLYVSGKYAYICARTSDALTVVDVSDPFEPKVVGSVSDSVNLDGARRVHVLGRYAYVVGYDGDSLAVVDVSDVENMTVVGSYNDSVLLEEAGDVYVRDNYAYVTSYLGDSFSVFDVSDPTNLSLVGWFNDSVGFDGPVNVDVFGDYAFVAVNGANSIAVVDVSNVSSPEVAQSLGVSAPRFVEFSGRYLYSGSGSTDSFYVIDVGGVKLTSADVGNLKVDELDVGGDARVGGRLAVDGALSARGIFSSGDVAIDGDLGVDGGILQEFGGNLVLVSSFNHSMLDSPRSVHVEGDYAYVTGEISDSLVVVDVTDPNNASVVGSINYTDDMRGAWGLDVVGDYAYVTTYHADSLVIIDVSNPSNPIRVGNVSNLTFTDRPVSVEVVGKYAYVGSLVSDSLTVIDVSNPNSPVIVGSLFNATYMDGVSNVYVSGDYVYIFSRETDSLVVADISDPINPEIVGTLVNSSYLDESYFAYVSGRYLYVTDYLSDSFGVVDVSNPTNPEIVGGIFNDSTYLHEARGLFVSGRYAYVASFISDALTVVDISDPTNPEIVGALFDSVNLQGTRDVYVSGRYAYVVAGTSDSFSVVDIGGVELTSADIGNVKAGSLDVMGDARVAGNLDVDGGLSVNGILSDGDLVVSGNVSADSFVGDGSLLTGIKEGVWENESGVATYEGGVDVKSTPWDISRAVYSGSVNVSAECGTTTGVFFKGDGTKMYVLDQQGPSEVNEYDLSIPWNISTRSFVASMGDGISIFSNAIFFKGDGAKMYRVDGASDNILSYDLSDPWNISSAVAGDSKSLSGEGPGPSGVYFTGDGLKMYTVDSVRDYVFEYDLSDAWNVSSLSYTGRNLSISEDYAYGLFFSDDGYKMYVSGSTGDSVYEYDLSVAWNVSSGSLNQVFDVSGQDVAMRGLYMRSGGDRFYLAGDGSDFVYEYDWRDFGGVDVEGNVSAEYFVGDGSGLSGVNASWWAGLSGWVSGWFVDDGDSLGFNESRLNETIDSRNTDYCVGGNCSGGLNVSGNVSAAYFVGDVEADGVSSDVYEYVDGSTGTSAVDGSGFYWDVNTAKYVQNFSFSGEIPNGGIDVFFGPHGDRLYTIDFNNKSVVEYGLSEAWDVSTASYLRRGNISETTSPRGLYISPSGEDMFVVDSSLDDVLRYSLSSPWDVSSAGYVSSVDVSSADISCQGLFFSSDGMRFYVAGSFDNNVDEFKLTEAWNISTANLSATVSSRDADPWGLYFNPSGTRMFVVGYSSDDLGEFKLSEPWVLSSAEYVKNFGLGSYDNAPNGVFMNRDGSKMYFSGFEHDSVFEFDLGLSVGGYFVGDGSQLSGIETGVWENESGVATYDGGILQRAGGDLVVVGNVSNATHLDSPLELYVLGSYAYVTSYASDSLTILDVSDYSNPVIIGYLNGSDGGPMDGVRDIYVNGEYAYVVNGNNRSLSVLDVSDPADPELRGTVYDDSLNVPLGVHVSGRYAYVTSFSGDSITSIDVTDSDNPVVVGNLTNSTYLDGAWGVYAVGGHAYVSASNSDRLTVVDISDPWNMSIVGSVNDSVNINFSSGVKVVDKYAYVAGQDSNSLAVFDVSNPGDPRFVGAVNDSTHLGYASGLDVVGKYAYVAAKSVDRVTRVDVSNASNPVIVGSVNDSSLNGVSSVYVSGRYAYAIGSYSDSLSVIDVSGVELTSLEVGNIETGSFHATGDADVSGELNVHGGINSRGVLSMGDVGVDGDLEVLGNVSAEIFFGNGSGLTDVNINGSELNTNSSTWWGGLSGWVSGWFVRVGDDLEFNESRLNETIDSRSSDYCSGGNCSGELNVNGSLGVESVSVSDVVEFSDGSTQQYASVPFDGSWHISTAEYSGSSYDVSSQDTIPRDIFFKPDGTRMYMIGDTNNRIYEYNLSTPWDLSSNVTNVANSTVSLDSSLGNLYFKSDGTKMYYIGYGTDNVYEFDLSTPWSITTLEAVQSFDIGNWEGTALALYFKSDGTKFYIGGQVNDNVYEFTLSTPWDLGSGVVNTSSFDISLQESDIRNINFKPDGTRMYIGGTGSDDIHEYIVSTPWNLSTASFSKTFTATTITNVAGAHFKPDGSKMYLSDLFSQSIYEYDLGLAVGGNVGIGTSAPSTRLHVYDSVDGDVLRLEDSDGICNYNPESGSVTVICSSDESLKEDIHEAEDVLDEFERIEVRDYKIVESGDDTTGVIAQEVLETNPEMVHVVEVVDEESREVEEVLFVEQPNPWKLLKAIQELKEIVDSLVGGNYSVSSEVRFDGDMVGRAVVLANESFVGVEFEEEYLDVPVVTVTAVGVPVVGYVDNVSEGGFEIWVGEVRGEDVWFNWHAFGVEEVEVENKSLVEENVTVLDEVVEEGVNETEGVDNVSLENETIVEVNESDGLNGSIGNESVLNGSVEGVGNVSEDVENGSGVLNDSLFVINETVIEENVSALERGGVNEI